MLTVEQEKMISDLVSNAQYQNGYDEFEFTMKYDECTEEQVAALNAAIEDPSEIIRIPDDIWVSDTCFHREAWVSVTYLIATESYMISGWKM